MLQRGQLPVFIPNYYRGAFHQFPRTAGRSSQLFNTGTVSWFYRCLVEGLFGLKGQADGLRVAPQLPAHWRTARVVRRFRGAEFDVRMARETGRGQMSITVDGHRLDDAVIRDIEAGRRYDVAILLPD